jgi:hypothetical protein
MTEADKIQMITTLLDDGGQLPSKEKLDTYLSLARQEILSWRYSLVGGVPADKTDLPPRFEVTQIYSVVAGYTHAGAEGESVHNENGIQRTFKYSDMLDYIHKNVIPIMRVGAVK